MVYSRIYACCDEYRAGRIHDPDDGDDLRPIQSRSRAIKSGVRVWRRHIHAGEQVAIYSSNEVLLDHASIRRWPFTLGQDMGKVV